MDAASISPGNSEFELSPRDREILEFERQWWKYSGAKEQAIREWLRSHNSSPMTRTYMDASRIVPNRALKDLIAEYNTQQQQLSATANNNNENDMNNKINSKDDCIE